MPGLISAGIFSFTLSWNEFIYALAFIQSGANKTVPVAILTELVTGDVYQWGALMAGSLLGSLPVALFYSLFVDYYVSSLTRRGVALLLLRAERRIQAQRICRAMDCYVGAPRNDGVAKSTAARTRPARKSPSSPA